MGAAPGAQEAPFGKVLLADRAPRQHRAAPGAPRAQLDIMHLADPAPRQRRAARKPPGALVVVLLLADRAPRQHRAAHKAKTMVVDGYPLRTSAQKQRGQRPSASNSPAYRTSAWTQERG